MWKNTIELIKLLRLSSNTAHEVLFYQKAGNSVAKKSEKKTSPIIESRMRKRVSTLDFMARGTSSADVKSSETHVCRRVARSSVQ